MSTPLVHGPVVLRDEYCVEQTIFKIFCYLLFVTMNGLLLAPIYARGGQSSAYLDQDGDCPCLCLPCPHCMWLWHADEL